MSGFGVLTRWHDAPDVARVSDLRSGIEHHGPDHFAISDVGQAVLLHAQFATTPEAERERQPTRHVRRDVWLTADARIDNRADLHRQLADHVDHPLDTDADYILAAYEFWGDDLARHLLGDFAFAIWDGERQHVLVVRDHIGVRPVYWALTTDGGFVASSTLRATLEASGRQREVRPHLPCELLHVRRTRSGAQPLDGSPPIARRSLPLSDERAAREDVALLEPARRLPRHHHRCSDCGTSLRLDRGSHLSDPSPFVDRCSTQWRLRLHDYCGRSGVGHRPRCAHHLCLELPGTGV